MTDVMSGASGRGAERSTGAVWWVAGVLAASVALVGCSAQGDDSPTESQAVATGVLLDERDGDPVSGVELELLVWPSPQSGAATQVADLVPVDTDTTGADGSFDLDAVAADLSRHASTNGQVGLEIRKAGVTGSGLRTTVRLTKDQETGTTTVETVTGLVATVAEVDRGQ